MRCGRTFRPQVASLEGRLLPGEMLLALLAGRAFLEPSLAWASTELPSTTSPRVTGPVLPQSAADRGALDVGAPAVPPRELPPPASRNAPTNSARASFAPSFEAPDLFPVVAALPVTPPVPLEAEAVQLGGGVGSGSLAGLPPTVTAWLRDDTGTTGCSPVQRIHEVVSQIPSDVQWVGYTGSDAYIYADGIPTYCVGPFRGPNVPAAQGYVFRIPHTPVQGPGTPTNLGPIGVLVNGVPIYNALDAFSYLGQDVWHQHAVFVEGPGMDSANGHPDMRGRYHHHMNPAGLREALGDDGGQHSPLLGWAFDGFPIYGPHGYVNPDGTGGIVQMTSSYRLRDLTERNTLPDGTELPPELWGPAVGDQYPLGYYVEDYEYVEGLGTLDRFNGRWTVTPEYPEGTFAYFVTLDESGQSAYPHMVGPSYFGEVARDNVTQTVQIPEDVVQYFP